MAQQIEPHILKKYSVIKKVGSGAYGHVWKVTDKKTGQNLALKKIFDAFQHSTDAQRTYREIVFLHQLNHPNIIKLFNVVKADNDKDLYLVFQFLQADLHNAIGQKILKDAHNRYILYQLVKGLKYMHSAEVIHRDLKPSNLLLNSDCLLKICDFGLARSLATSKNQEKDIVLTEEVATRWYRAPQVLLGSNNYDKSADIWSVGCILAEIIIGKPIFPGNSTLNQLERILSFTGKPKNQDIDSLHSQTAMTMINQVNVKQKPLQQWFKSNVPQSALQLVTAMLNINPKKRPTASQILKHPYLSSFSKPKEQFISNRAIQPPISDNTKLNLKEYRKLIYERIKKIYTDQKQSFHEQVPILSKKNSVQKSIQRQSSGIIKNNTNVGSGNIQNMVKQRKVVSTQVKQNNQSLNKYQKPQQRPFSHNYYKKTQPSQDLGNSNFNNVGRAIKTSNSSHISSSSPAASKVQNARYFGPTNNQKKVQSNSVSQKNQSLIQSNSSAMIRNVSDQKDSLKKKNSLKQILKSKKQINVQSAYNVQQNVQGTPTKVTYTPYTSNHYFAPSANYQNNNGKSSINSFSHTQQSHNDSFQANQSMKYPQKYSVTNNYSTSNTNQNPNPNSNYVHHSNIQSHNKYISNSSNIHSYIPNNMNGSNGFHYPGASQNHHISQNKPSYVMTNSSYKQNRINY